MRVVAGSLKGRPLVAPRGDRTRPTSDRVRQALFNVIEARFPHLIPGATVLDLYSGTGALAIEAISRGATKATLVENNRDAVEAIRRNVASLDLSHRVIIHDADANLASLPRRLSSAPFTLLFLDPPYRMAATQVRKTLAGLSTSGCVAPGAIIVWEHSDGAPVSWPEGYTELVSKRYGATAISVGVHEKGV